MMDSIPELILQTENQISLLRGLIRSHAADVKTYPTGKYANHSIICIEHCYNTLLRLNEVLTKPIEVDGN